MLAFLSSVPQDVVVVLDEAYNEYLPPAERVDTAAWIADFPNLVVTRTFSKIFGLAGLRIGYGLMPPYLADILMRVHLPFSVNVLAEKAAIAARKKLFAWAAKDKLLISGMHLPFPGIGHVRKEAKGGYAWVPVEFGPLNLPEKSGSTATK